jgi:hypothetical protein
MEDDSEEESESGEGYQGALILPEVAQDLLDHGLRATDANETTADPKEAAAVVPVEVLEAPVLLSEDLNIVSIECFLFEFEILITLFATHFLHLLFFSTSELCEGLWYIWDLWDAPVPFFESIDIVSNV